MAPSAILVKESGDLELSDVHLAATKNTDLVKESGDLELSDVHLPATKNTDLVRASGSLNLGENHLAATVADFCLPPSRMNTEKQKVSKKKRKKRQHGRGGGEREKKSPTTNKNQDANGTPVACYECGIVEFSTDDYKVCEDWIQCCTLECKIWCHESCGEKGGILDDDEFFCAKCALAL